MISTYRYKTPLSPLIPRDAHNVTRGLTGQVPKICFKEQVGLLCQDPISARDQNPPSPPQVHATNQEPDTGPGYPRTLPQAAVAFLPFNPTTNLQVRPSPSIKEPQALLSQIHFK